MHHNINLLYLHIVLASFLWKKGLCNQAATQLLPSISITLCQLSQAARVEASMSCYSSNNLHDVWPGHYMFSLQLNVHGLPGTRMRDCSFQLVRIPPLSAFWIGNAQLTHTGNASLSSDLVYSALLKSCFDTFTVFLPLSSFLWHSFLLAQSALNN